MTSSQTSRGIKITHFSHNVIFFAAGSIHTRRLAEAYDSGMTVFRLALYTGEGPGVWLARLSSRCCPAQGSQRCTRRRGGRAEQRRIAPPQHAEARVYEQKEASIIVKASLEQAASSLLLRLVGVR